MDLAVSHPTVQAVHVAPMHGATGGLRAEGPGLWRGARALAQLEIQFRGEKYAKGKGKGKKKKNKKHKKKKDGLRTVPVPVRRPTF